MKDFLGQGWAFPISVDPTGRITLSQYEDDIREALRIILLTAKGERVMRPDFGASLHDFVFESMNATTIGRVQAAVTDALVKWEPRIEVIRVNTEPEHGEIGKLLIDIEYKVRATNNRFNFVFPFYLKEQA